MQPHEVDPHRYLTHRRADQQENLIVHTQHEMMGNRRGGSPQRNEANDDEREKQEKS